MKKLLLLLVLTLPIYAQNSLTNKDIIDLTKAGIAEDIIVAKIRSSKASFDTSTPALIELKSAGISDTVIKEMVGIKPEVSKSAEKILELKDAINLRKVYIDSEDDKAKVEISEILKKNGFTIVPSVQSSELVFKFEYQTRTSDSGISPGIFGGIYTRGSTDYNYGKLRVFIRDGNIEHMIFLREKAMNGWKKSLSKQAKNYSEEFIEELNKLKTLK